MTPGGVFFVGFVVFFALAPAIGMVIGGARLMRSATTVDRVAVEAVVVHYPNARRARTVTFDYPAPNGQWLRARRLEGFSTVQRSGYLVRPGDRVTVYVDPANPADVTFSPAGSGPGIGGVALVVGGIAWGLIGLSFAGLASSALA